MRLIAKKQGREIWAHFDHTAEVWELFFDSNGETYTGWACDSLKDAKAAAKYIFAEVLEQ